MSHRNQNRLILQAMIKLLTGMFMLLSPCLGSYVRIELANGTRSGGVVAPATRSTVIDGREWVGESTSFLGPADPDPAPYSYMASSISATEFRYAFPANPKLSLSSSYLCYEKWKHDFSAEVGLFNFTLRRDHITSLAAHTWNGKSEKKKYAFVGGMGMPPELNYNVEQDLRILLYAYGNALVVIQSLCIEENYLRPVQDFRMFGQCNNEKASYLLGFPRAHLVSHLGLKYGSILACLAPPKFYRQLLKRNCSSHLLSNFTWERVAMKLDLPTHYGYRLSRHGGLPCREQDRLALSSSSQLGLAMITLAVLFITILVCILNEFWNRIVHKWKYSHSKSYHCFSLAQIRLATQNFSEEFVIGKGGFGRVYRGLIPGFPNVVAMKRLDSSSRQGAPEFRAEIETLSKLRHINLVSLIGCCNDSSEMILVYEYIPGGTLADNLYKLARKGIDCLPIAWEQRLRICIGVARGLEYLHTSSEFGVIHRDLKDTNILLDDNFVAKISDFGLAKLEQTTQSKNYVVTKVKGTAGYLDPDYARTHRLTRKSDVYSFGIVMLVVLSGKPALDTINPFEPESVLSRFRKCMANGDVSDIIDPRLHGEISSNSLKQYMKIIENCLHLLPNSRPTMARVVSSLERELELHQNHIISALVEGYIHLSPDEAKILEKPAVGRQTQNPVLTTRRVSKPLFGWPWKAARKGSLKSNTRKDDNKLPSNPLQVGHLRLSLAANFKTVFTFDEIKTITNNFRQDGMLGVGGLAKVYHGFLPGDVRTGLHPTPVAIKVHSKGSFQGCAEWQDKAIFLGQLSHPNLVKLIGYCCENEHRVLVYEYVAGGSLDKYLFSRFLPPLSWSTRMRIASGAAKGLTFLHHGLEMPVIFRDFKTSDILLDLDCNVKLSNLWMAMDGPIGDTPYVSSRAVGHLTRSSGVYSYGVVVLQLLTGRILMDPNERHLIDWAMPSLRDKGKLVNIIDPRLEGDCPIKDVQKVGMLAYTCLNADPQAWPSMQDIKDLLESLQERV